MTMKRMKPPMLYLLPLLFILGINQLVHVFGLVDVFVISNYMILTLYALFLGRATEPFITDSDTTTHPTGLKYFFLGWFIGLSIFSTLMVVLTYFEIVHLSPGQASITYFLKYFPVLGIVAALEEYFFRHILILSAKDFGYGRNQTFSLSLISYIIFHTGLSTILFGYSISAIFYVLTYTLLGTLLLMLRFHTSHLWGGLGLNYSLLTISTFLVSYDSTSGHQHALMLITLQRNQVYAFPTGELLLSSYFLAVLFIVIIVLSYLFRKNKKENDPC